VGIHEMLDGVERLAIHADDLSSRLRAAAPDALESRPPGEEAPEPLLKTERPLDGELSDVVR